MIALVLAAALSTALTETQSALVGPVKLVCETPQTWRFQMMRLAGSDAGVEDYRITLTNDCAAEAPHFALEFTIPQRDISFVWHTGAEHPNLPPKWHRGFVANLANGMPLMELIGSNDRNGLAFGASECVLPVRCRAGLKEQDCTIPCGLEFFEKPSAPRQGYEVRLRLDARRRRWDDTVRDLADWMGSDSRPMAVPEAAREPLYSTWYAFTQDVSARKIEDEARRAAALGMRTLILDDGWQTDEKGRAYERCGDLLVSTNKFPKGLAAHVAKVHAAGLKYIVWTAVPFVGYKSPAFAQFKGKYLRDLPDVHCSVLDPRFPEVRAHLVALYEKMLRDWGVDGFKLDYVGQMDLKEEKDPAIEQNFAGRDVKGVADGVDLLMTELLARLTAIRPDLLIEYRQPYLSPGIRRFGNMIRAIDCPGERQKNQIRTAMLRLTSGETAVHSDMLEWNDAATPEESAEAIISALFSTIQYSVVLSRQTPGNLEVLRHWIAFTRDHRDTLLKGRLQANHPEANYPVVSAETERERIVAIYTPGSLVALPDLRPTYIVNGTCAGEILVDLPCAATAELTTASGQIAETRQLSPGLQRLKVPVSGRARLLAANNRTQHR